MPDSRTLDAIFADLVRSGFKNLVLIADRGHEPLRSLEKRIPRGQSMILNAKTCQRSSLTAVEELNQLDDKLNSISFDPKTEPARKQGDIEYHAKSDGPAVKAAAQLRLSLHCDLKCMAGERLKLEVDLSEQRSFLNEPLNAGGAIEDIDEVKRDNCYFKLIHYEK